MSIDTSVMDQLKAHVSNEIQPIKWQSEDPGERMLEATCAVLGLPYQPPKGYSPMRRWLRQERAREAVEGRDEPLPLRTPEAEAFFELAGAEIELALKRQNALWWEVWGSPEQSRRAREELLRAKGWSP